MCGEDISDRAPHARFCFDCRSARQRDAQRRYKRKHYRNPVWRERQKTLARKYDRKRYRDPVVRERRNKYSKKRYHNDPDFRERIKERNKERIKERSRDPVWRERRKEYYRERHRKLYRARHRERRALEIVERYRKQIIRRDDSVVRKYLQSHSASHIVKRRLYSQRRSIGHRSIINALRERGWLDDGPQRKKFAWTCETCQREKPCSRRCKAKRSAALRASCATHRTEVDRYERAVINALRELGWLKGYEIQLLPAPTPTQENLLAMIFSGGKNDANE